MVFGEGFGLSKNTCCSRAGTGGRDCGLTLITPRFGVPFALLRAPLQLPTCLGCSRSCGDLPIYVRGVSVVQDSHRESFLSLSCSARPPCCSSPPNIPNEGVEEARGLEVLELITIPMGARGRSTTSPRRTGRSWMACVRKSHKDWGSRFSVRTTFHQHEYFGPRIFCLRTPQSGTMRFRMGLRVPNSNPLRRRPKLHESTMRVTL